MKKISESVKESLKNLPFFYNDCTSVIKNATDNVDYGFEYIKEHELMYSNFIDKKNITNYQFRFIYKK